MGLLFSLLWSNQIDAGQLGGVHSSLAAAASLQGAVKEGHLSEVRRRGIAEYSLPDTRFPGSGDFSGFHSYVTRETRDAADYGGALPEGLSI